MDAANVPVFDFTFPQAIITEREKDQDFELDIRAGTVAEAGSVAGEHLWIVEAFFNDNADGTGNDYGSSITANLEPENYNRAVSAGNNLVLDDVEVSLSAENLLCGSASDIYLCVRLSRNASSDPAFTLKPESVLKCNEIVCNRKYPTFEI